MRIRPEETQAVFIDFQERLMPAMSGREQCEERGAMLMRGLKILEVPFLVTQQYTKGLGETVPAIREASGDGEDFSYFDKCTFSCIRDPAIREAVEKNGRKNVLIAGTEAHVCVLQTCIDLKEAGYRPVLVTDAIASRKESDRQIGIYRAMQEGALLTTAEAVLFELLVDSKNPHFREISKLVK
ncbi:MAG: isochorismatase family protein [Bilifractor sp.]|jgi:hypothetical protein